VVCCVLFRLGNDVGGSYEMRGIFAPLRLTGLVVAWSMGSVRQEQCKFLVWVGWLAG
jgi:hypothetical protein